MRIAPSFDALAPPLVPSAGSGAIDDAGTPGLGADRSQGMGVFTVTRFEKQS